MDQFSDYNSPLWRYLAFREFENIIQTTTKDPDSIELKQIDLKLC